jgi:hypothetical protein
VSAQGRGVACHQQHAAIDAQYLTQAQLAA